MNFPLPPKNADVVQKLHPIGQPTDGMMVAAVPPFRSGRRIPMMRVCMPETMAGWWIGAFSSSPRYLRIQEMPSPRTMWSASIVVSSPGSAATCPPTTITDSGESSRTMRHISRTLPKFTMMAVIPTMS